MTKNFFSPKECSFASRPPETNSSTAHNKDISGYKVSSWTSGRGRTRDAAMFLRDGPVAALPAQVPSLHAEMTGWRFGAEGTFF